MNLASDAKMHEDVTSAWDLAYLGSHAKVLSVGVAVRIGIKYNFSFDGFIVHVVVA